MPTTPAVPQFLTPAQVSRLVNVHVRTVQRLTSIGEIRSIKVGGQVRIPVAEVQRLLGSTDLASALKALASS